MSIEDEVSEIDREVERSAGGFMTELKPCTCAVNEGCSDECDRGTTFWEKAISEARELKPSSRGNVLDYVENRCRELRPRPAPDDGLKAISEQGDYGKILAAADKFIDRFEPNDHYENREDLELVKHMSSAIRTLVAENEKLRYLLCCQHQHSCYTDDGEMQCGECDIDFVRDSADEIQNKMTAWGIKEIEKAGGIEALTGKEEV